MNQMLSEFLTERVRFCSRVAVMMCLVSYCSLALAGPKEGVVVSGKGAIHQAGTHTQVDQHTRDMVVDWRSFNLGQKESVHFEQANSNYSVLNRIHDSTASQIWGQVTARGQVWLLNPNGVFFNKTARVNVGGLVAAGLWMSRDDFMSGRYVLDNSRGAGNVVNEGELNASSGSIGLFGLNVVNNGRIRAKKSKVVLASGAQAMLDFTGDGLLRFALSAGVSDEMDETDEPAETEVVNTGEIEAQEIELTMHSAVEVLTQVVNNEGILRARRLTKEGGVVRLDAGAHGEVHVGGVVDVSGDDDQAGGQVTAQGRQIEQDGEILADGSKGGTVDLVASERSQLNGRISARGLSIPATDSTVAPDDAVFGPPAPGAGTGGYVSVQADVVDVGADTLVDASGHSGGGEILVGGDWQGKNPDIQNAQHTTVAEGAQFKADALSAGDGGKVVFWSDHTTDFAGTISARGGPDGGDGGRAEVSGKQNLRMRGWADMRAPRGRTGKLLLDPGSIRICDGADAGCAADPAPFDPMTGANVIQDDALATQLGMADVTITTADADTGPENITVDDAVDVSWTEANTLTLTAGNDILLQGSTFSSAAGSLALNFGNMLKLGSATLSVGTVTATGTGGGTSIQGQNVDTTWMITSDGSGTVTAGTQSISFSGVENLTGGSAVDTFNVNSSYAGNLYGGGDGDIFNINAQLDGDLLAEAGTDTITLGTGGSVTGMVDGNLDGATLSYAGRTSTVEVTLTGLGNNIGFNGTATDTGGFIDITAVIGGSGVDTLTGSDSNTTWTVSAHGTGTLINQSSFFEFSAIENLTGGSMVDTFIVDSAHTGYLTGGAGSDVFIISAALTGSIMGEGGSDTIILNIGGSVSGGISGGADADTFVFNGGTVTGTVAGGGDNDHLDMNGLLNALHIVLTQTPDADGFNGAVTGGAAITFTGINDVTGSTDTDADTLTGWDASTTWTVFAEGTGTVEDNTQTLTFSSVENLTGGSMVDTFIVNSDHTGDLTGGGGADVFNINNVLAGMIMGGGGDDVVNVDAGGTVTLGIDTGANNDTVNLNGGTIMNGVLLGAGEDTFVVTAMGGMVTGTVDGGSQNDHLDMTDIATALTIYLANPANANGFNGQVTGGTAIITFTGINQMTGGTMTDTLTGRNAVTEWTITSDGTGTVVDNTQTLTFHSIANLTGGSMVDTFTVNGAHTGDLTGSAGSDTLNLNTNGIVTGAVNMGGDNDVIVANGGSVSGYLDGGADTDTLVGPDADTTWTISGDTVTIGMMDFTTVNVETLQGGSMVDTFTVDSAFSFNLAGGNGNDVFTIQAGGRVMGMVDGGADDDHLNMAGLTDALTIALSGTPTADGFGGSVDTGGTTIVSFSGINQMTGGTMTDTLHGLAAGGAFILNAVGTDDTYETSTRILNFRALEHMTGGAGDDTFTVVGVHTGNLSGGNGDNTYTFNNRLSGSVTGGDDVDTLILDTGAQIDEASDLGDGNDVIVIADIGSAGSLGNLDSGGGIDTLRGPDVDASWGVNGDTVTLTIGVGTASQNQINFTPTSVETLQGGNMVDTFDVDSDIAFNLAGSGGADIFMVSAALTGSILGEGGADTITMDMGGSVSGMVDGGADGATLVYAQTYPNDVEVTMTGVGDMSGLDGTANAITGGFANITALQAGTTTTNTLIAISNMAGTFTWDTMVNGGNTYVVGTNSLSFDDEFSMRGGAAADTFNVNTPYTGELDGRGGADIFNINAQLTGDVTGGAGADTLNLNTNGMVGGAADMGSGNDVIVFAGGSVTGMLDGGADTDRLQGPDADTTWAVMGTTVTIGGMSFTPTNVETLQGGSMVDTFTVDSAFSFNLAGGDGNDVFTVTAALTGSIMGEGGDDTITLDTSGSVSAGISGGAGDDTFDFNGGTVTGTVAGGGDDDHLDMAGVGTALTIALSDTPTADGFSGNVSDGATIAFTGINEVTGGGGVDTLTGRNAATNWDITMEDAGTLTDTGTMEELAFSSIANLTGGSDIDTYTIGAVLTGNVMGGSGNDVIVAAGGSVTGTLDGGADTDRLQGPDADTIWAVMGTTVMIGGIQFTPMNVETLQGGSMADIFMVDSAFSFNLAGGDGNDEFTVTAALTGSIMGEGGNDTITLDTGGSVSAGISGGAGDDTFEFNGGTVTGTVAGGGDDDHLDMAGVGTALTIALSDTPTADGFSGNVSGGATITFTGIDEVTGGSVADTLTGRNADTTWEVIAGDAGTLTDTGTMRVLIFNSIANLTGGSMADTYTIGALLTGDVTGGDGADTLTLNTNGLVMGAANMGGGNDVIVAAGGHVMGTLDGGADTDRLQGPDADTTWAVMGTTVTIGGMSFTPTNVETLQGGSMVDTFTVDSAFSFNLAGGDGNDEFTVTAALTGSIMGEGGSDTITLDTGGSVSAGISGGAGEDTFEFNGGTVTGMVDGGADGATLSYAGRTSTVEVTLTGLGGTEGFAGTATDTGGFDNIVALEAGSAIDDSFTGLPTGGMLTGNTMYDATVGGVMRTMTLAGFEQLSNSGGTMTPGGMVTGPEQPTVWTIRANEVSYEDAMGMTITMFDLSTVQGGSMMDTFNVVGDTTVEIDLLGGGGADVYNIGSMLTGDIMGEAGADTIILSHMGNIGSVTGMVDGGADGATLSYAGSSDSITVTLTDLGDMTGFDGTATRVTGGFANINTLTGSSGVNTLIGRNAAATFTLAGAGNTYVNGTNILSFSAFENLTGGSMADTFVVSSIYTGNLDGGAGDDVFTIQAGGRVMGMVDGGADGAALSYAGRTDAVMVTVIAPGVDTGFAGMATDTGGFDDIIELIGSSSTDADTLTSGRNVATTWTVSTADAGTLVDAGTGSGLRTLTFSSVESLTSGNGVDTFNINATLTGDLMGGDGGADILNLNTGGTVMGNVDMGTGNDIIMVNGGGVAGTLDGGADTDTLQGPDADTTWTADGTTLTVNGVALTLSNIEKLQGGSGVDTFIVMSDFSFNLFGGGGADVFTITGVLSTGPLTAVLPIGGIMGEGGADTITLGTGGSVAGVVDGGADGATLSYDGRTSAVDVELTGTGGTVGFAGTATDITGGFDDISTLIGSSSTDADTLTGRNAAATFTLAGTNEYVSTNTLAFSAFENLTGGSMADTFVVNSIYTGNLDGGGGADIFNLDMALTGNIMGGAGNDVITLRTDDGRVTGTVDGEGDGATLSYAGSTDPITVTLTDLGDMTGFDGMATRVTGGFANIHTLTGSSGADELIGRSVAATFTLDGTNTYASGTGTLSFSSFENLTGGSMADTFVVSSIYTGDLDGGDGDDVFTIQTGGRVVGTVDGGADDDHLNMAGLGAALTVTLTGTPAMTGYAGSVSGGTAITFSNINEVTGGTGTDTLRGLDNDASRFTLGATDTYDVGTGGVAALRFNMLEHMEGGSMVDTFIVNGPHTGDLRGNAGNDVFTIQDGGVVTGTVDGGADDDHLNMAGITTALTVTLSGTPVADGYSGSVDTGGTTIVSFSDINQMTGGTMTDTLRGLAAGGAFILNSVGTDDTYETSSRILNFRALENIVGGAGDDTFTIAGVHMGDLSGGNGDNTFTFNNRLTGGVTGGDNVDTLILNAGGQITAASNLGDGNDVIVIGDIGSAGSLGNLDAGTGIDTLRGPDVDAVWGVSGSTVTLTIGIGVANQVSFTPTSVETLQGGSMVDTFNVDSAITFNIAGGGGADVFTVTAALMGSIMGEGGADTITMGMGGSVSGMVDGGADGATLIYAQLYPDDVTVTMTGVGDMSGLDGTANAITGGFANITALEAGTVTANTLIAISNMAGAFTLDTMANGGNTYVVGTNSLSFNNRFNVRGGAAADTFIVNTFYSGDLQGLGGADIFNINAQLTGDVLGGAGIDIITFGDSGSATNVNGEADGAMLGYGGAMDVEVRLIDLGTMTGFSGNFRTGTRGRQNYDNIIGVTGGTGTNTLSNNNTDFRGDDPRDAATTWEITGNGVGTVTDVTDNTRTLTFSGFADLIGGGAIDTFIVSGDHTGNLRGGKGNDVFTINAVLTGMVTDLTGLTSEGAPGGSNGNRAPILDAGDDVVTVNAGGTITGGVDTGVGADTVTVDGGSIMNGVTLGDGTNTVILNSGSIAGGITGGANADTFDINGGTLTGAVAGGGGADHLDMAGVGTALTIALSGTPDASGFDGTIGGFTFTGINEMTGGTMTDTLQGLGTAGTFTLGAADTYVTNGQTLMFSSLEDMEGGSAVDTFIVSGAHTGDLSGGGGADLFTLTATLTGDIMGDGGDDTITLGDGGMVDGSVDGGANGATLSYAGRTTAVEVTLVSVGVPGSVNGRATGITGSGVVGFSNISELIGSNAATDTLIGPVPTGPMTTWTITGTGGRVVAVVGGVLNMPFSEIENLTGTDSIDIFNITTNPHTGNLSGGGGNDVFTIDQELTGMISGDAGDDTVNVNAGGTVTGVINTGADDDTVNVNTGGTAMGGIDTGTDDDTVILNGGTIMNGVMLGGGEDTFRVTALGGTLTDTVDGGADDDELDLTAITTALTVNLDGAPVGEGFGGMITGGAALTFAGINEIAGGTGTDTLQGLDTIGEFTLGTTDTYQTGGQTLTFSSLEDITGGSAIDTFTITGAHTGNLSGGDNNDVFTIGAMLTGMITGGDGNDMVNVNAGGTVTMVINTGANADTVTVDGGTVMNGITLGNGTDTVILNTGTIEGGITGGAGADTFDINGGTLTGTVDGGANDDHLDMADIGTALTVALSGADGEGFDGTVAGGATLAFDGINEITGGSMTDTLQGLNIVSTFTLGATDTYQIGSGANLRTLTFNSLENMEGGSAVDTFIVSDVYTGDLSGGDGADIFNLDVALTGNIMGGAGDDTITLRTDDGRVTGTVDGEGDGATLSYAGSTDPITVTLTDLGDMTGFDGLAPGVTGGFANIHTLTGSSAVDMLIGRNVAATFTLDGTNTYASGTGTLSFSSFENLTGGSMADTFVVSSIYTGNLNGGAGDDVFTIQTGGRVVGTVDGGADGATLSYAGRNSTVEVTLTGLGGDTGFAGTATDITGGFDDIVGLTASSAMDDSFTGLPTGGMLTGNTMYDATVGGVMRTTTLAGFEQISNPGGTMTPGGMVTGPDQPTVWTIRANEVSYEDAMGMTITMFDLNTVQGGSMMDTFNVVGDTTVEIDLLGGGGADVYNIGSMLTGNIMGEAGADTITLGTGGSVTGMVDGGADGATLSYDGRASAVSVVLTGLGGNVGFAGTATGIIGGFDDISTLIGSSSTDADTLTSQDVATTWTVSTADAGSLVATRTLTFSAVESLTGGSAVDTFEINAALAGSIMGGGGADILNLNTKRLGEW